MENNIVTNPAATIVAPTNQTAIRKERILSPITVDNIEKTDYQKEGTLSAQLRQVVTIKSYYPSKRVSDSMNDSLFSAQEFNFEETEYITTENRVTWRDVPENITMDKVVAQLGTMSNAILYRVLSNTPILTDHQEYAITQGQKTLDDFAENQIIRYPDGTAKDGVDVSGQIVLDNNGKVQYRRIFFSITAKEDIDNRTADINDQYITDAIEIELKGASIIAEQTI